MSFRSFLKRVSGPLRAVPVLLMGRLVRVFRRLPARGVPSRTRPRTATDSDRLSGSGARESAGPPAVDAALPEAAPNEPGEKPSGHEDSQSEPPPRHEERGPEEIEESKVAPSETAVEDDSREAYPLPDGAGEHAPDVAGTTEAINATPQEEDSASEGQAGSDDGRNGPTSEGEEMGPCESNETTREQQPTRSEATSTASPDTEGRNRQAPERNDDGSHAPVPVPRDQAAPNDERATEPETAAEAEGAQGITPPVDESDADAAATGSNNDPDTQTRERNDGAEPAPAEPKPPTVSPPRVTAEGPRRSGEPWRFGARRAKNDSTIGARGDTGASPPELKIRYVGGRWEVVLSVDLEAGPSRVLQGGEPLPHASDRSWLVPDFCRDLEVETDNAGTATIPLYTGREPLIFRQPTAGGSGTQRRRMIDRGKYVVIAPDGKLGRGEGVEFQEPEPCGDRRFVAHFFDSSAGPGAETVDGFPEWDYGATTGSASLAGNSVFDSSEDGELFVGETPTLDRTEGIEWARIGEERAEGWKGRNFLVAEEAPGDVLNGACGRFFLRTYRTGKTHLADSRSFRYWPDLKSIEVNGRSFDSEHLLMPGTTGHGKVTVRLVARAGKALKFELMSTEGASVSTDGTITVAPYITADELCVRLCRTPWHMDLIVALPRVWWRLQGSQSDWTSTPLSMSRREFRTSQISLEMLVPDSIRIVRATLGDQIDLSFRTTRTDEHAHKRYCAIPLENFADHPALQDAGAREDAMIRIQVNGSEVCVIHVPPERSRRAPNSSPVPAPSHETPVSTTEGRMEDTVLKNKVVAVECVKVRERDKNLSFTALVIVGDGNGRVGFGRGDGRDVPSSVEKGNAIATKNLVQVRRRGTTIAHEVEGAFGASRILLKPAPEGTGIIARGLVRAVLELAGIENILAKSSGTRSRQNVVAATLEALRSLRSR